MKKIEVVLIESAEMRKNDADMLRAAENFQLKAEFDCAADAMEEIALLAPDVVLLDADAESDMIAVLRALLTRSPHSELLCLGARWDEERQRDFLSAGAKGCLVRPFTGKDVLRSIEQGEESVAATVRGKAIAFFSPKGKSGKTTLVANLAMALARRTKESVAVIDADVQFGDMAVFFNLQPETTIVEATRDVKHLSPLTLDTYFAKVSGNVKVLCGTRRPQLAETVSAPQLAALIELARATYSYVLLDLPQGFNPLSIAAAEAADLTYLVTMLGGAYECEHLARSVEIFKSLENYEERLNVVITRVTVCDDSTRKELESKIGYPVTGMLPNAYQLVSSAANGGRMASDIKPNSPLAQSIDGLVGKVVRAKGAVVS